ncbi:MAG: FtsW/RodA/SpoVE family cell cycle protein [Saprospiraceae bacterium]
MQAVLNRISTNLKGDRRLWAIYTLFALCSMLAVYSASGTLVYSSGGTTELYMLKQLLFLLMGFGIMYVAHFFHYSTYGKWANIALIVTIGLLMYTLIFGDSINEAKRWITLPFGLSFQTSDLAEPVIILYLARNLATQQKTIKSLSSFLLLLVPVLVVCGLILPANFSTAALLFAVCFLMMAIGRVNTKYLALTILIGVGIAAIFMFFEIGRFATWASRVAEFTGGDSGGYQVQQSKMALSEGRWFGSGPGNSIQRNFLPYAYADFIYAIIIEEYGLLIGGLGVMFLYMWLFVRVVRIVTLSQKTFAAMLALGLGLHLTTQALANMAVSVNLVPVTGLTLPFISMGGTSLMFSCVALGLIISVSKEIVKKPKVVESPQPELILNESAT